MSSLPQAQLLHTYYDASLEHTVEVLHPTLLWEDPRCPTTYPGSNFGPIPLTSTRSSFDRPPCCRRPPLDKVSSEEEEAVTPTRSDWSLPPLEMMSKDSSIQAGDDAPDALVPEILPSTPPKPTKVDDDDITALDATEWPSLSTLKTLSRRSKARR